ncbi:MAG: hypothetical protein R3353_00975 [Salegentibacter mishustinae]|nr:hypothetical protein [Salegentibacter mishustinae]
MATIYEEIRNEFSRKLESENIQEKVTKYDIDESILSAALEVLLDQYKRSNKGTTQDSSNDYRNERNELINFIEQKMQQNETK